MGKAYPTVTPRMRSGQSVTIMPSAGNSLGVQAAAEEAAHGDGRSRTSTGTGAAGSRPAHRAGHPWHRADLGGQRGTSPGSSPCPPGGSPTAAQRGVGMSPVFDVYLVDDSMTTSPHIGGPDGDLRLFPDLERLTPLAAQPGWAWAPADRYDQSGLEHPACQRLFARRMTERAAGRGHRAAHGVRDGVGRHHAGTAAPALRRARHRRAATRARHTRPDGTAPTPDGPGLRHGAPGRPLRLPRRRTRHAAHPGRGGAAAAPRVRGRAVRGVRRPRGPGGRRRSCRPRPRDDPRGVRTARPDPAFGPVAEAGTSATAAICT